MRTWILVLLFCLQTRLFAAEKPPQRIASGTVGTDEILVDLLTKKGEMSRLIAVSMFSDDPKYSFLYPVPPSIKGRVGSSLEALLALKPDLAILSSYNKEELPAQLRAAGVKVIVQGNFRSVEDIENNIRRIGTLIGAEAEAAQLVAFMEARIQAAVRGQKNCRPTLLQYSSNDVLPGVDTIFNNAAERAGFKNVTANMKLKGWAQISQEVLVQMNPDFVVVSKADAADEARFRKMLLGVPGWGKIKAVKEGRFIFVPDRLLYTVSQHIVELVEHLAKEHRCR